jgi:hypothetical protein
MLTMNFLLGTGPAITCEMSLGGHSLLNQELDVAIAQATTLVNPTEVS